MLNKKVIIILAVIIFFSSAALVFFLAKRAVNNATVNQADSKPMSELKNSYPGLSAAQLKFYVVTASKGGIEPCLDRQDEAVCVSAVAFIKGNGDFCDELDRDDDKTKKLYQACLTGAIKKTASIKLGQCAPLLGDDYYNCLGAIFAINNIRLDCAVLSDLGVRTICEDFFNYWTVYLSHNRELCKTIKDKRLNQYCLTNIINKK